jgi:hypothetical protein
MVASDCARDLRLVVLRAVLAAPVYTPEGPSFCHTPRLHEASHLCTELPVPMLPYASVHVSRTCLIRCSQCLFRMIGRPPFACAFANASTSIGELSVRMVVPMDMKKLHPPSALQQDKQIHHSYVPKCRRRSHHVLSQRSHHSIWSRSVSYDVRCAEDEPDNQSNSCDILSSRPVLLFQSLGHTASHHAAHLHFVKGRRATHAAGGSYWRHLCCFTLQSPHLR